MALSADRNIQFGVTQELLEAPVDDNVVIYKGAFVGRNRSSGYARPLIGGDDFLGIAYRQANNTLLGHVAGGVIAKLQQHIDVVLPIAGLTLADVGKDVYAVDDAVATLSPASSSKLGRVVAFESAGVGRVRLIPTFSLATPNDNWFTRVLSDTDQALTLDHVNRTLLMGNTAARILTLPPVASVRAGGWIRVVKTTAAAFAITLDGNAAETIDGAATLTTIDANYDCALLLCTGTEWIVVERDIT